MRNRTSNGMAGLKRQGLHLAALRSLAAVALLGWSAIPAAAVVAGGSAVNLVVSSGGGGGGDGGGGGAMAPFTLLALLALLMVGWWRTRSAFLRSEQETESESRDLPA